MRLPITAITTFLLSQQSDAFVPSVGNINKSNNDRASTSFLKIPSLQMAPSPASHHHQPERKKLSAADILARARQSVNKSSGKNVVDDIQQSEGPAETDYGFDEALLDDMKTCLVMLEKRVKEGPGSLSNEDIELMRVASTRVLSEINEHGSGARDGSAGTTAVVPPPSTTTTATVTEKPRMDPTIEAMVRPDNFNEDTAVVTPVASANPSRYSSASALADTISAAAAATSTDPPIQFHETSDEEGAAYTGKGGMGLATGTRNTYVIPGMDEMSPEEYRKALQESVSERQRQRREKRSGLVGTRAALQYLDQLGYGGASDNWRIKEDKE